MQRVPELFSYLQQVLDDKDQSGIFILTGSNNFLLQENITQSLAGRIGQLTLLPFCLSELKQRLNSGKTNNLYFWRDNTGHEVDVLLEANGTLYPVEIKSGETITPDYFKAINYWNKISGNTTGTIIYGGNQQQKRSNNIQVLQWNQAGNVTE